jgi:hypothetical protein
MTGWPEPDPEHYDENGAWMPQSIFESDNDTDTSMHGYSEGNPEAEIEAQKDKKSRNWVFTLNNPCANIAAITNDTSESGQSTSSDPFLTPTIPFLNCANALWKIRFCVWQLEIGSSGTQHIQGYLEMKDNQRFSTITTMFGGKARIAKRKGTRHDNIYYCTKEDREEGPWHYSTRAEDDDLDLLIKNAKHSRLSKSDRKNKRFIDAVINGATDRQLQEDFPTHYLRYDLHISRLRLKNTKPRNWKMNVIVIQGPKGCGKSKFAFDYKSGSTKFWKSESKWWCGYDLHETVVLDDFYGRSIAYSEFLKLLDRYPFNIEAKGKTLPFVSKDIIITTNGLPGNWYKYNFDPIDRRISTYRVWNETTKSFDEYDNYKEAKVVMKDWSRKELFGDN